VAFKVIPIYYRRADHARMDRHGLRKEDIQRDDYFLDFDRFVSAIDPEWVTIKA
jgi:hypothetical protein